MPANLTFLLIFSIETPVLCYYNISQPKSQQVDTKLKDCIFQKIPIGNYRAGGWLKNQLRLQADGLCGNLDKIWPDVRDSAWLGGNADSWERLPCWLDGVVPLAFLLDDPSLKKRVGNYVRIIVGKQQTDGWLAPCNDRRHYDLWAEILMLKVLSEYAEYSGDASVDECVFPGASEFIFAHRKLYDSRMGRRPLV